jgi:hypothetical protein
MFELTATFIAAFSASIFVAHVVEAYLAGRSPKTAASAASTEQTSALARRRG